MTGEISFTIFCEKDLTLFKPESDIAQPQLNNKSSVTDACVNEAKSWILGILNAHD